MTLMLSILFAGWVAMMLLVVAMCHVLGTPLGTTNR
jgi:hypothetical protein